MVVREIYARLGIKVDKTKTGEAKNFFTEMHSKMELLQKAFEVGKSFLQEMVGETLDYAKEISRAAEMTGLSTESIQGLAEAAGESRVEFATLQEGLLRLQKNGFGKADEKLWELVDTFERVQDPAARAALATQHFGKSGQQMIPMLSKGRAALEAMIAEGREFGNVMGPESLQAALDLRDGLQEWKNIVEGLTRSLSGPFIKSASKALRVMSDWVKENRKWLASKIEWGLQKLTDVLRAVWNVGRTALEGWKQLVDVFGAGTVAAVLLSAAVMAASQSTMFLALKWIAIGAVIALVTEDIVAFLQGQPSLIGAAIQALDDWFTKMSPENAKFLEDHPILAFLGTVLWTITHITKAWETFSEAMGKTVIGRAAYAVGKKLGGRAVQARDPETGLPLDAQSADQLAGYYSAQRQGIPAERPGWQQGVEGGIYRGVRSAQNAAQAVFAPQVAVTVNAQTGASPDEIANAAAKAVNEQLATANRAARAALVPSPAVE
jgi:hypothetical protein